MKQVISLLCVLFLLVLLNGSDSPAAVGKCTVVDTDGNRMIIDCKASPKGFGKGSKIKIKSDNDKAPEKG